MNYGLRFLPSAVLQARYLDGGHGRLAGFWYEESALTDGDVGSLITLLGLNYTTVVGEPCFDSLPSHIGVIRFPVTRAIHLGSAFALSSGAGGFLPNPPDTVRWTGNGFAPSESCIPEHVLESVELPQESEALLIDHNGHRTSLARYTREGWRML